MLESQMTMKELLASIDARYEKEACEAPTFEEIVEEAPVVEKKEVKKEKKEEKPKIYIPNFAFPFKRISKHDKEKSTYDLMMESLFIDKEAQYLFNRSGLFHGGVHLNGAKFCANTFDKENIRAIADGKVIAYRIDKEALENEVNAEYFSYTTGFFLLEHFMEYPVGNKLKFYSLYMHMAAMEEYEFPTYVLCGSKEYVKEGSASGVGIANTFGKEVTLTGEKVGDRFVIATLDGEKPSKKLVVHKSNLMRKKELHTTTTKGKGINLRYHQKNCKSWKSLKIATDELKAGVIIVVASKKLKCNRYEVISVDGKLIIESNDKEDKTKKVEQMVSISASNLTEVPKVPKKSKDSFENGLVSEKMETDKVVELEDKEQIKVKAGDVLGKLGFYSYDWIEEPMVHLEVFTFDDVKAFQKNATTAYEKEEEEEKYEVKGDDVPIVKGWRNSSSVLDEQKHYLKKGTAITVTKTKKKVGGVIRQEVIEINGSDELVKEGVWTIYEKQVIVKNKKQKERPTPNILYVPKETTEIFEKGYDDTIYAKVTKNTNIRKGTTNEGEIYGKKTTKKGTELVLGATTTETKVVKSKEKEAHSYYRQSVLEIAGKKVEGYSIHTAFFEIIEKDVFVPKESNQKLKTSIVKPIKNLKIEKDKDSTEYIEIAQNPKLYVKKYKNKKQTKSWFTHGVTLKMFDVMEKEGTDKIGIFEDTVSFYDQRESNSKTQIEKETLNPLFNEILQKLKIDKDKNGRLEAGELAGLMLTQEKQKELSYIVAKHESEWEDPTRFEALATFMDEMKATEYAKMMRERTKNLSFFDDVMAMDFSPTFFHPLALVGSMVGSCSINIKLARVKAFLQMLRHGEGTVGDKGYETIYGGKSFIKDYKKDWSSHPSILITAGKHTSSAAGAYQILDNHKNNSKKEGTWEYLVRKRKSLKLDTKLNLNDFSPSSQDLYAVLLLKRRLKGVKLLSEGKIEDAIDREYSWEWASLPTSDGKGRYGQPTKTMSQDLKLFEQYYKAELEGKSTLKASNEDLWFTLEGKKYLNECSDKIEKLEDISIDAKVILKITRYKEWAKKPNSSDVNIQQGGTLSRYSLSVDGVEKATGYMLEAAGPDSKVSGSDQRVLAGTYSLMKNSGSRGDFRLVQLTKELAENTFGKRSLINIHIGNYPRNIEGCFAPGTSKSDTGLYPFVSSSGIAYKKLKKIITESSKIQNIDSYDGHNKYTTNVYVDVIIVIKNNF